MKFKLTSILLILASTCVFSHEGHDMPGAMPPAPHGGEVKAAEHEEAGEHARDEGEKGHEEKGHKDGEKEEPKDAHNEKGNKHSEEEAEVFFEVVYAKKSIKIYPLTLNPKNPKIFASLPVTAFKDVTLNVELPRQKKTEAVKVNVTESYFEATFDPKTAFRFFAKISATHEGEVKKTSIQVEIE